MPGPCSASSPRRSLYFHAAAGTIPEVGVDLKVNLLAS